MNGATIAGASEIWGPSQFTPPTSSTARCAALSSSILIKKV